MNVKELEKVEKWAVETFGRQNWEIRDERIDW